jgi:membrane fusion protein, multidrug efflux system
MTNTRSTNYTIHSFLLALLAVLVLLQAGCGRKQAGAPVKVDAAALSVKTVQIETQALPLTVVVTGSLVSNSAVDVKAETTGRLLQFTKQEGDAVSAGETVAMVDEENYKIAVRQAQAAVQVADASLARTRVLAAHGKSELARSQNLVRSGGITEKDVEAAQLADRDAQAQVAVAEAQLAQARVAQDMAEKRLRDAAILAPVGGVIQRKYINPGAYVEPPTMVFSIVDNRQLELESPVPTALLGQIRAGQRVTFQVNSYPGSNFEGRVGEINPAVDALARSAKVRVRVDNTSGKLKAGMFVEGEILTGVAQQAVAVPAAAVYRSATPGQDSYVFVVDGGKAARRPVQLGREMDNRLEITSGLKPGDALVAEQRIELAEGVRVEAGK